MKRSVSGAASSPTLRKVVALSGKKKSNIELGVMTAQVLTDKRKQDKLRRDISSAFPLIPAPVVNALIEVVADGFQAIAPEDLRRALRPGYIAKNRAKFKKPLTAAVLETDVMKDLPVLGDEAKGSLVNKCIDLAIDQFLSEADGLLTVPELRLAELEDRVKEVKAEMGPWRVGLYRVRRRPALFATTLVLFVVAFIVKMNDPWATTTANAYWEALSAVSVCREKTVWAFRLLTRGVVAASVNVCRYLPS